MKTQVSACVCFRAIADIRNGGYAALMNDEPLSEVGIDEQGSLYLRPSHSSFEYIYRAGKEIQ
jgi:hypothetical protein